MMIHKFQQISTIVNDDNAMILMDAVRWEWDWEFIQGCVEKTKYKFILLVSLISNQKQYTCLRIFKQQQQPD